MKPGKNQIESNLRLHVDRLAGLIGPRYLQKPKTILATIGYFEGQWGGMGYKISHEYYDALGDQAINLIVEQSGSKQADEIILLGAHYDTVYSTPGADDNASAVAVLLEVSRLHRGDFLAAVGNMPSWKLCWSFRRGFKRGARSMPLFSICLPEKVNEVRLSDNSSFWDQGYRALMLTDTSFLRNPNYHRSTDTPDTLDYQRMTEVTIGVASALRFLAS